MKTRKIGARVAASGTSTEGVGLEVSCIGLGGMYLSISTGAGERLDEAEAVRTVHAALDAGVTFIDTADVYCLDDDDIGHNERVIARALRERGRKDVVVATKGGLRRPRGAWTRDASPGHLREACEASLVALGVDVIDLYQLHAPDPKVPLAESVGELARLRQAGKIRHVGLSNVSVSEIEEASRIVPIVSVQNRYSPMDRSPERDGVIAHCEAHGLAFLPYSPFGGARGAVGLDRVGTLAAQAKKRAVSPHRLVLAWMLTKGAHVVPIPGARRAASIVDSAGASELSLSSDDVREIEASFG